MSKVSTLKIKQLKIANGYTNRKVSQKLGVPIATIDRILSGANANPKISLLLKLADLFHCTVDDFIEYDDKEISDNKAALDIAKEIVSKAEYKELFTIVKGMSPAQSKAITEITSIINKNVN